MEQAPKQYSEADMLKALEKEGVTIVRQPKPESVVDIDYSGFESEYPKQTPHIHREIKLVAEMCEKFLSGAIITDAFDGDHLKRREWRHMMYQKYGDAFDSLYSTNKLRINNIGGLQSWFETIGKALKIFKVHSEKSEAIQVLAKKFPSLEHYDENTVEQKLDLIHKMDTICKEFLELVAKK